MKKIIALVLAVLMLLVCLSGCGKAKDLETIHVGTGGSTGTYYGFSQVVGNVLGEATGYQFDIATSGGSKDNIESLVAGTYDMAIVQNDVMSYAYNGTDIFDGKAIKDFSVIAGVYMETVQVVAKADAGISSVADLAGKRVSVGDAGSGVEFNARQILAANNIDIETGITKNNLSFGDSASALKDNAIDAFFCVAGAPTTAITELGTTTDVVILDIDAETISKLKKDYTFYSDYELTHADYAFIPEGTTVKTVAVTATYIITNEVSEDQAYKITKALWEKQDEISAAHAKGKEMDIKKAATALGGVPLHPGAEKYYKEVGVIA